MTSPTRGAVLVLFPLLSVTAVYCLMVVATDNGLFKQISDLVQQEQPMFPGSQSPLARNYTGVGAVDRQLTTLVAFFGPVVQGGNEPLNLFSLFGLGQFGVAWTLLTMESFRKGNQGKAVSFIGTYGLFVQNLSYAICTPLYLFIHLLTSPTTKPSASTLASSVLFVSTYDMAILPVSVTLGYLIPSLLTVFPTFSAVASPGHQYLVAFWQAFPLWTLLVQWALKLLCILIIGKDSTSTTEKMPYSVASRTYLKYASRVYTFSLAFCVATCLPAVVLSLLPPDIVPDTMPGIAYLARTSFTSTFIPPLPLGQPIRNMAEGVHIFLLWDMYIGSVAGLLWAIALYQNVSTRKESAASRSSLILKTMIWTILGGPVAAWTILVWERDKILVEKVKV